MNPPAAPLQPVPPAAFSREDAVALREKLSVLIPLCARREELHAAGHARVPPEESTARKRTMADLAARFPGALRELDGVSPHLLAERAAQLDRWLGAGAPHPLPDELTWAVAQHLVHQQLRQHLEDRRTGRPGSPRPMTDLALEHAAVTLGLPLKDVRSLVYPRT